MVYYARVITDHRLFFTEETRNKFQLAPEAAEAACVEAVDYGLLILGVEGGIWQHPGFMALLDSLWTGNSAASTESEVRQSNEAAVRFIRGERRRSDEYAPNVFILTARRYVPK